LVKENHIPGWQDSDLNYLGLWRHMKDVDYTQIANNRNAVLRKVSDTAWTFKTTHTFLRM
jgi:hypothetical protein